MMKIKKIIPSIIYIIGFVGLYLFIIGYKIGIFCVFLFTIPFIYEFIKYRMNCEAPLNIKTPDDSNQPYHPSVVFFKNKWNGYRYWMAYTPFPIGGTLYRDRWEYPCVCVSNDGINWKPVDKNDPLDDLTIEQIKNKDYFSDTHLVYNEEKDRLECYYRLSEEKYFHDNEKGVWIFRKYTYDGYNWSNREIAKNIDGKAIVYEKYPRISPAIIKDENYRMWYVINVDGKYTVLTSLSEDGLKWTNGIECKLNGLEVNIWHIDCKFYKNKYYILAYDFSQKLTLWESNNGIDFEYCKTILNASQNVGSFYKTTLYRACMLKDNENYKVYFSAGNDRKVKIGLMYGNELDNLSVYNFSKKKLNLEDFIIDYFEKYFFIERWIIWKIKRRFGLGAREWF